MRKITTRWTVRLAQQLVHGVPCRELAAPDQGGEFMRMALYAYPVYADLTDELIKAGEAHDRGRVTILDRRLVTHCYGARVAAIAPMRQDLFGRPGGCGGR